ncbi:hypothetical protein ACQKDB_12615 [Planococcus kocurii]|uniref:hypothetical protein n=1 Tax=Planococcus kocurii TaxID=1374 RepID=UPI003D065FE9
MPTFRVTMNNTKSNGDKYDSNSKYGVSHYHVSSETMIDVIALAENRKAIIRRELTNDTFLIEYMIPQENYELMTSEDRPSDTIIYRKDGNTLHVLLRSKNFKERGSTFWYDLFVADLIRVAGQHEEPPALTQNNLEQFSFEIYRIVTEPQIPATFVGKMGRNKLGGKE